MKYEPDPKYENMSLDQLLQVNANDLNTVQRLQVKKRIALLEKEAAKASEIRIAWWQKWSFWLNVAVLVVALLSAALSLAATPSDMLLDRTDELARLCSVQIPADYEKASQDLRKLYKSDPILANDIFLRTISNYQFHSGCIGYVGGFKDAIYVHNALYPKNKLVCFPENGINNGQAAKIFLKWVEANPEHLHNPPSTSLLFALRQAFPCDD